MRAAIKTLVGVGLVVLAGCGTTVNVRPGTEASRLTVKTSGEQVEITQDRDGKQADAQQMVADAAAMKAEIAGLMEKKVKTEQEIVAGGQNLSRAKEAEKAATQRLADLQQAIAETADRRQRDEQAAGTMASRLKEAVQLRDTAQAQAAQAAKRWDEVKVQAGQAVVQRDAAKAQVLQAAKDLDEAKGHVAQAGRERDAAKAQIAQAVKDLDEAKGQVVRASKERDAAKAQVVQAAKDLGEAKGQVAQAGRERDAAKAQIAQAVKDLDEAKGQVVQAVKERDDAQAQTAQAIKERDDANAQVAALALPPAASNTNTGTNTDGTAAVESGRWKPWIATFGAMVAVVLGVLVVLYFLRRPVAFAFTLLNEDTKVSHNVWASPADRVELGGTQPTRKAAVGKPAASFLTVNRKGRLTLHAVSGVPCKLNGREIGGADTPEVKAGAVVEVSSNGQASRLIVGPVTAVKRGQRASVKSPVASVRPA
jgi:hypothetical protein